ncbi:MAG: PAS domain S-box protein [Gloeocapsa sp. UFS-A4-WI-NPMV-4B04]|nr:PAS domain S-box protein [Gloeocapsa sp. UFS-A4-WI-NPMV-4B04]
MSVEKFAQKIQDVRWHLVELQERANRVPLEQQDLLVEAFEEFQTTLEELFVAEEELCAANEEMAATRAEVEVERQRYQDLFEFAPDGYLVTDINGVIQEANRAVAQLLNVSQKFLVGKPLYVFFAQEVRDDLFAKLTQLQQVNFAQEWEVCLQPRNNTPFSAALTVAGIRKPDDKLTGLRWLLRDISDRKRAELQDSEQRFRQLAENVNQVFWISDVETAEIIYISSAYEKLWGSTCSLNEECKYFIDNILPEDRDRVIPLIEKQKQGELSEAEYRIVHPDGEIRWISTRSFPIYNELGQTYRACGIVEDITQRKQAELALWQQSKREQALNRFTDAVRKTLDLKTIFATAAQEISQLLDVDCVEIQQYLPNSQIWLTVADYPQNPNNTCSLGTEVSDVGNEISSRLKQFEVVQIDDTKTLKNAVSQKLAQVYPGAWLLVPLHFQDSLWGSLWLKISARSYHWSEWEVGLGKVIAAQLAIAIQQGQFYQQLNELNANLEFQVEERTVELQQKVEELQHLNILKDDFLSTVSHELRSPLTNMKMSIQMLKITGLAERQQRYLDVLQTECDREINLINDLLDLQQLQAESYAISLTDAINLHESLPKIVEPFHYRAVERQQSLKLDISPDIPPLISHLTGLERILAELLNNACKYTPTGGEVIFRVSHDQQHTPVTTFTISNPAEIPAAALPRIFEKFYRVPNADPWKQGGTGLGLSLVQKLVEQLGGTIFVESEGGWTSFIVQFHFNP